MTGEWLYQPAGFDPDMYADLPAVEVQWVKREDGWYCRIKSAKPRRVSGQQVTAWLRSRYE